MNSTIARASINNAYDCAQNLRYYKNVKEFYRDFLAEGLYNPRAAMKIDAGAKQSAVAAIKNRNLQTSKNKVVAFLKTTADRAVMNFQMFNAKNCEENRRIYKTFKKSYSVLTDILVEKAKMR